MTAKLVRRYLLPASGVGEVSNPALIRAKGNPRQAPCSRPKTHGLLSHHLAFEMQITLYWLSTFPNTQDKW
jgi:hypothetical protein